MRTIKILFVCLFAALLLPAQQSRFFDPHGFKLVLDSMNFPEGPAYDGHGSLFVSSCYGGFIKKIGKNKTTLFVKADSGGIKQTNGLTFNKEGVLFACDFGCGNIQSISTKGKVDVYASGYEGKKFNRPNDLAFDSKGNLYFSDPKTANTDYPDGRIFKIERDTKKVVLLLDSIAYPNGIAFLDKEKKVFICESAKNRILVFDVTGDCKFINKKVFVDLPGGSPDGIALDSKCNLYAAHFGGGMIYVISPKGDILEKLIAPGKKPSNLEFAGKDLKTLYLTEDETNSVYTIKTKIPGLPLLNSPVKNK
jgi:gluconolactonase